MSNTKEKQITANEMANTLKELLKKHVVDVVQRKTENGFDFYLPGGKVFHVFVKEK